MKRDVQNISSQASGKNEQSEPVSSAMLFVTGEDGLSLIPVASKKMHAVWYTYKEKKLPRDGRAENPKFMLKRNWAIKGRRRRLKPRKLILPFASAVIFILGGGGAFLYLGIHMTQANGTRSHVTPSTLSIAPPPIKTFPVQSGAISAYQWVSNGSKQTAYVDVSGHVQYLKSTNEDNWQQLDLTRETGSAVTNGKVVAGFSWAKGNRQQIAYIDALGHIHVLWAGPDEQWHVIDVSQLAHAPQANGTTLVGYDWLDTGSQQLVYIDQFKHVEELSSADGMLWTATDVTKLTGSPVSNGIALAAFSWTKVANKEIVYTSKNRHIVEISSTADGLWQSVDLTKAYGAPVSNGNVVVGYDWRAVGSQQIDYIDNENHLQELSSLVPHSWTSSDLTIVTKRPVTNGKTLAGYDWLQGNARILLYVDANKHIQELSLPQLDRWKAIDLTQITTSPLANNTGLLGYVWNEQGRKEVVYVDSTQHIHSLMGSFSGSWKFENWG